MREKYSLNEYIKAEFARDYYAPEYFSREFVELMRSYLSLTDCEDGDVCNHIKPLLDCPEGLELLKNTWHHVEGGTEILTFKGDKVRELKRWCGGKRTFPTKTGEFNTLVVALRERTHNLTLSTGRFLKMDAEDVAKVFNTDVGHGRVSKKKALDYSNECIRPSEPRFDALENVGPNPKIIDHQLTENCLQCTDEIITHIAELAVDVIDKRLRRKIWKMGDMLFSREVAASGSPPREMLRFFNVFDSMDEDVETRVENLVEIGEFFSLDDENDHPTRKKMGELALLKADYLKISGLREAPETSVGMEILNKEIEATRRTAAFLTSDNRSV